jgi:RNA polymerase sigma factor (sigma-70 family)
MKSSSFNKITFQKLNHRIQEDFKTTIQFQFDCMARKVMIRTRSNCYRSIGRQSKRECLFSEMSESELNKLQTFDTYNLDSQIYEISSLNVEVIDCQIAEVLDILSKRKRDIILMYYYLEMSDTEIAEELSVSRYSISESY